LLLLLLSIDVQHFHGDCDLNGPTSGRAGGIAALTTNKLFGNAFDRVRKLRAPLQISPTRPEWTQTSN
jgi:hypothetical protein